MDKKKLLIVDDSALMRRMISGIITSDDRFCVGATATDGMNALEVLEKEKYQFDGIILDINMPKMNGLEFLQELGRRRVSILVLVVSTLAKQGAHETIKALEYGAFDFVTKPDSFAEARSDTFQKKVIESLAAGIFKENSQPRAVVKTRKVEHTVSTKGADNGQKLVALACSTGGPKALQSVIPKLPANLDAAFLLVQHMPEGFTHSLAGRLNELSKIKVKEAEDGEIIQKGTVYIAMGGRQMRLHKTLKGYQLAVTEEPPRNALKPCADIMYESLAQLDYQEVTCVVMTGMGSDGTQGIKTLNESKSIYVIAQDAKTSTVYGMPKAIAESGLADEVVPLEQLASAIEKHVGVR